MSRADIVALEPPAFLYGTAWKEERTEGLTKLALRCGFRGIDTANQRKHYFEEGVGNGVMACVDEGVCSREALFLQTKFTFQRGQDERLPYDPRADLTTQVQQSFQSSLTHLHTDYLDSYVLHGPTLREGLTDADWEVWQAMEALYDTGQVYRLGVSNCSPRQLQALVDGARIPPSFIQNRCYARFGWDAAVLEICQEHGVRYQGFSLLTANRAELGRPEIGQIADSHQATVPQLVFAFARHLGMLPLTGTSSEAHMLADLDSGRITLERDQILAIANVGQR
jgi:diketogulonate reductase-like aldo/keto reductase